MVNGVLDLGNIPINVSDIIPVIISQLPPETAASLGTLITILQAVGIFFLIYLIFQIVNIILSIRRGLMIKKTYNKVNEIDEKLKQILHKKEDKDRKKSEKKK